MRDIIAAFCGTLVLAGAMFAPCDAQTRIDGRVITSDSLPVHNAIVETSSDCGGPLAGIRVRE